MKMNPEELLWGAYRHTNPIRACEDHIHLIECKICLDRFESAGELLPCNGCTLEIMCQQCSQEFMASHVCFQSYIEYNL